MKRKLNEDDVPESVEHDSSVTNQPTFDSLGLDTRILSAVRNEKFSIPTPVQARAIPLALEGRDILAHAKTGSGKTAAYILPIINSLLKHKARTARERSTSALILVPTRELANQVTNAILKFSSFGAKDIKTVNLATQVNNQAQRGLLSAVPDIVVSTPARASMHLNSSTMVANNLVHLVIDEADLVLSYGYEDDLRSIVDLIPKGVQTFLASATLNTEVDFLKGLFCRNPVVLDLQDEEKDSAAVSQYAVRCGEDEKFLLIFALFKLKLIRGKCIVFVGDVDRCYRLKLYLEQFGIKSCILNSELPLNSRVHVIEEFNKDFYDIIIATDEHEILHDETISARPITNQEQHSSEKPEKTIDDKSNDNASVNTTSVPSQASAPKKPKRKPAKRDKEYGISRGIDFHNVACVLNFDLPTNANSYTHRIGRTARANRTGIAISFAIPASEYRKHKPSTFPTCKHDEDVLASIIADQGSKGQKVEPYRFDMAKLEGFRYRVASALKAVSSGAIKEARIRELRQEMLKSERLKRHLEENPEDLRWLRHDTELRPAKVQPHLKHVPQYLMPKGAGGDGKRLEDVGFVGLQKSGPENGRRNARMRNKLKGKGKKATGRKADPLKTFNARGKK